MSTIRLYADEDSMDQVLINALRARAVDVRTTLDEGMRGQADIDQLRHAAAQQRVSYSSNIGDFYQLHTAFLAQGDTHAGIILVQQQRYSVGEQLRGLLRIIGAKTAEEMANEILFLSAWVD